MASCFLFKFTFQSVCAYCLMFLNIQIINLTDIEINNGIVYEIRSNFESDESATRTIHHLAKDQPEFSSTYFESIRKKIQLTYNKTSVNDYAELKLSPLVKKKLLGREKKVEWWL